MIAHVVLLQPKADLTEAQRAAALDALSHASDNVPEIRRFRIGRRITHGLPGYEQAMTHDFEYLLFLEFDDAEGLKTYLTAPAHQALGTLFYTATSAALAYDYQMEDATDAGRWR